MSLWRRLADSGAYRRSGPAAIAAGPTSPEGADASAGLVVADRYRIEQLIGEGGIGFNAYHFDIVSTGTSNRNSTATTTQSFYIIGPGGP